MIAVGFTVVGIVARSGLLISLAVLALSSSIGARTDYMHATYLLGIQEPTVSIVLFSLVAVGAYQASKVLPPDHERLAIIAARTAILLVNFGFWIGSLRGDNVLWKTSIDRQCGGLVIVDEVFIVLWVVALTATGFWAARNNRLWVVNVVAVFGAIHFYTQWFERLGLRPETVLLAGVLALGLAWALWHFNRRLWETDRRGASN